MLIETTAGGMTDVSMSLMFGAVTAIDFGPLKGQGRIVAGVLCGKGEITGFVEAVGEGNIACFSISIYIRISLTHKGSDVYGTAIYRFRFKVGFASVSFRVKAEYLVKGGKAGRRESPAAELGFPSGTMAMAAAALAGLAGADAAGGATIVSAVPKKSSAWNTYREHLAWNLLKP